ncbi:MAG: RNA polymerase sigma factor [Planctomycetota bacterium]
MEEFEGTRVLLSRWHRGDAGALDGLLARDLNWIQAHVRRRLGWKLRQKAETNDIIQEAVLEFLRYGPRFIISNRAHFRALLSQIVENVLRHQNRWFTRRRRDMGREESIPDESVLDLDGSGQDRPSVVAQKNEQEQWLRLGLELLDPEDQKVLVLRNWDDRSFAEIGAELGIAEDAARMRYNRALPKLAYKIRDIREGRLEIPPGADSDEIPEDD